MNKIGEVSSKQTKPTLVTGRGWFWHALKGDQYEQ